MKRRMLKLTALAGTAVTGVLLVLIKHAEEDHQKVVRVHQTEVIH